VPVTFVGEASNARELMAGLDLFVLPSRIEGFANVLLEAAMLGTPILATEVGAARDVIVDDEDLVPVGDVDALAARLTMHLSDLDGCRARASRRRTFVRETFTVDRMVQRWLTLYARS
jgi:glycosyltransferase involved in cell wall biosynthesis